MIEPEIITEAKIRKGFVNVVLEAEKVKTEDDRLFRLAVVSAAGSLVCTILDSMNISKEDMLGAMAVLWNKYEDKRLNKSNLN